MKAGFTTTNINTKSCPKSYAVGEGHQNSQLVYTWLVSIKGQWTSQVWALLVLNTLLCEI